MDSTWARVERVMRGYLYRFVYIVAEKLGGLAVERFVRTSKSWRAGRRLRRLGHELYCRSPAAARGERRERKISLAKAFCSRGIDGVLREGFLKRVEDPLEFCMLKKWRCACNLGSLIRFLVALPRDHHGRFKVWRWKFIGCTV